MLLEELNSMVQIGLVNWLDRMEWDEETVWNVRHESGTGGMQRNTELGQMATGYLLGLDRRELDEMVKDETEWNIGHSPFSNYIYHSIPKIVNIDKLWRFNKVD